MNRTCLLSTAYWAPIQYFTKMLMFDTIIIEQFENYPRQTYRNRMAIYGANGFQTLQVPVVKASFKNVLLKDVEISYDMGWQKNHFKSIESAYRSAPFYEYYIDEIQPFYTKKYKYLFDFNQGILAASMEMLELNADIQPSTQFELHPRCTDFRDAIHPKENKQEADASFVAVDYLQGFEQRHGFIPNLSILDLVFNTGPEALSILKESISR